MNLNSIAAREKKIIEQRRYFKIITFANLLQGFNDDCERERRDEQIVWILNENA